MYELRRGDSYNLSYDYSIIEQSDVVFGGNLVSPRSSGEREVFVIQLPDGG